MEKGIVFSDKPKAFYKGQDTKGAPEPQGCKYKNNMFYEKYSFTLENPQAYDRIYMKWNLKNPIKSLPAYAQKSD